MASSAGVTPSTSSAPGSPSCPDPADHLCRQVEAQSRLYYQGLKLKMANHARLMQDNQRLLDRTAAADKSLRDQRRRFREAQLDKLTAAEPEEAPVPDDDAMGDVNIDSPTTVHNHYPPPPVLAPARSRWPAVAALTLGLLAAGAGSGAVLWLKQQPADIKPPAANEPAYDALYEQQMPDGSWKLIRREHLK